MLDLAASLGRDFRLRAAVAGVLSQPIAVITPVAEQYTRVTVALVHEIVVGRHVVRFAGRQHETDGQPLGVAPKVELGREAAARTAKSRALSPPLPPAAH